MFSFILLLNNTEKNLFVSGFKNVSEVLGEKTGTIGGAKDLAMDLQKRANDLAAQASNKLSFLSGKIQIDRMLNYISKNIPSQPKS